MASTSQAPLLIELLTEELPPKALKRLGASFATSIAAHLIKEGLCAPDAKVTRYASPRRLGVHIAQVMASAPDREKTEKLLPVAIAFDGDGKPTAPLLKKLSALGLATDKPPTLNDFERSHDGIQEQLIVRFQSKGAALAQAAQAAVLAAIAELPIPKVMGYQLANGETVKFVRPAHGLVALFGADILAIGALGLAAGRTTWGHRFHAKSAIAIRDADSYAAQLRDEGKVIASFEERRAMIVKALHGQAAPHTVIAPDELLDEVTSLVEWPVVLSAGFDAAFLDVPQECLILTMQQNQKYFALTDAQGKLVNRFLLVSNIASKEPQVVISGNERVLRARLADAAFFFDQDRKKTLASRLDGLASVVYHNKIGSQRERIDRLAMLASRWATAMGGDAALAQRAAMLAKADLLTDMVGEFPELQGTMGTYYARHDGEPEEIALAIEGHYHPRFSGDALPSNPTGTALALADKIETLIGIWGVGMVPTGDKDPYALRRHALGVVRILIEGGLPLRLDQLLRDGAESFAGIADVKPDLAAIESFVLDRLRAWLKEKGHGVEAIEAVIAACPHQLNQVLPRLDALKSFMQRAEAAPLCAANKRIGNILKKSDAAIGSINPELLHEAAEQALAKALALVAAQASACVADGRYAEGLAAMAALKEPVDAFFDHVMVHAEDAALRANRLALLQALHQSMNQVADLSRLAA
jgi:glycyl-tRNA synthetase beta chain